MRALIIEDDHDQALYNSEALARLGIHSEIVDTSTEANLKMHRSNYDVIMVDMELKGGTRGEEVLDYAKTFSPTKSPMNVSTRSLSSSPSKLPFATTLL